MYNVLTLCLIIDEIKKIKKKTKPPQKPDVYLSTWIKQCQSNALFMDFSTHNNYVLDKYALVRYIMGSNDSFNRRGFWSFPRGGG